MVCKITAKVTVPRLSGVVQGPPKLSGSVALGGPIMDGIYSGGVRQVRQFQQVLEELRLQHQPEHWASWTLDGSLEEDGGRFPLNYASGWEWVDVGGRQAVKFDGLANTSIMYGTDEDFQWVHEERVFTLSYWYHPREGFPGERIIGTNNPSPSNTAGFIAWTDNNGRPTLYIPNSVGLTQGVPSITVRGAQPAFHTWVLTGLTWKFYLNGNFVQEAALTGEPRVGHSYSVMEIGWRSNATIWNAFATNAILTDAEIYRLYVAGMQEMMG